MRTEINVEEGRISAYEDNEEVGRLLFETENGVVAIMHTYAYQEGRGIGKTLVVACIEYARDNGLKINPVCSYAHVVIMRNQEYHKLLSDTSGEALD